MAFGRARRRYRDDGSYWPGFVDAMATLLLVMTFLLSVLSVAQYFVTQEATGKDNAIQTLNRQILELTNLLSLEKNDKKDLESNLALLKATLADSQEKSNKLEALIGLGDSKDRNAKLQIDELNKRLKGEKELSKEATTQVALLNQQLAALRRQIAALNEALEASEVKDKEQKEQLKDLGARLNVALAKRVQELSQYRSDFFGRLRKLLGNRPGIRVVGDRFVFQSEVLFTSGSDELNPAGQIEMSKLASAVNEIRQKIPGNIKWVLRIDGHTDRQPINTPRFPSNWELSSSRATSVVRFLINEGVPANRLVAAGFGENHPLDTSNSPEAFAKNRRIELKLTEK
ncbi:peptidoglycan -binding protein [Hyphomicrobiales bacterium 4NK60-0047b]|jgi:chemotaxis protein MotB